MMERAYRVFKRGSYRLKPFVMEDRKLEDTFEVSLSEYGSREDLGCGLFRMSNNSFSLTYPNDEVMFIVAGEVEVTTGGETLHLERGDILQVREGLAARISTDTSVEIFYASYPIARSARARH
jgi:ethanolamine utilization protein EutQ (cupin superfamily)